MLAGTRFTDSAASEFHPLWFSFKAGLYSPKDSVSTVMAPLACWEHSDVSLIISGGPWSSERRGSKKGEAKGSHS